MPTRGNTDDRVLQIWLQVPTALAYCVSYMPSLESREEVHRPCEERRHLLACTQAH